MSRQEPYWTNREELYLRGNFDDCTGAAIAVKLGRTRCAVLGKAMRLGLRKTNNPPNRKAKKHTKTVTVYTSTALKRIMQGE